MDTSDPVVESEILTGLTGGVTDDDTFKILIASDIHLGYNDNNPARENDSFVTFEEILKFGREENVDFVLLGGDLFHENKPKPACLQRTIEILRKYCLGSKPVEFEYLGDPKIDFPNQDEPEVNFLNPDINIAMPVFTIHGNHDDPVGTKKTSAVDHLVAAKLVNHFGQWEDLNKIKIRAVPLIKGETKLALFGLGSLKDERLFRLMRDNHVTFARPAEAEEDWFNIFVVHQNRAKHGAKNYIPESFIPEFFDLVLWGHEHECRIDPEPSDAATKTYIIQPGSSVATSLCPGEAKEKYIAILHVNRRKFRVEKKKLETIRPMMFDDIIVADALPNLAKEKDVTKAVEKYVQSRVEMLIKDSLDLLSGHPKQPTEPLIRVRIHHETNEEAFNPMRFSHKFEGRVANDDIVMFKRVSGRRNADGEMDLEDIDEMFAANGPDLDSHVETIVENFFQRAREAEDHANILEVLSERGLSEAVKSCVEKDDKDALTVIIESQIERVIEHLIRKNVSDDTELEDELSRFTLKRLAKAEEESAEALSLLKSRPVKTKNSNASEEDDDEVSVINGSDDDEVSVIENDDDDDDEQPVAKKTSARGRGRGGKATTAAPRGRGRGRGRGKANTTRSDDDEPSPPRKQTTRGRGGRGAAASSSRGKSAGGKTMIQTTLPVRKSPRKSAMTFDSDSD